MKIFVMLFRSQKKTVESIGYFFHVENDDLGKYLMKYIYGSFTNYVHKKRWVVPKDYGVRTTPYMYSHKKMLFIITLCPFCIGLSVVPNFSCGSKKSAYCKHNFSVIMHGTFEYCTAKIKSVSFQRWQ